MNFKTFAESNVLDDFERFAFAVLMWKVEPRSSHFRDIKIPEKFQNAPGIIYRSCSRRSRFDNRLTSWTKDIGVANQFADLDNKNIIYQLNPPSCFLDIDCVFLNSKFKGTIRELEERHILSFEQSIHTDYLYGDGEREVLMLQLNATPKIYTPVA